MNILLRDSDFMEGKSGANEKSSEEMIHVKVLIIQEDSSPGSVCIELTSDDDLFFHYKVEIDEKIFNE